MLCDRAVITLSDRASATLSIRDMGMLRKLVYFFKKPKNFQIILYFTFIEEEYVIFPKRISKTGANFMKLNFTSFSLENLPKIRSFKDLTELSEKNFWIFTYLKISSR